MLQYNQMLRDDHPWITCRTVKNKCRSSIIDDEEADAIYDKNENDADVIEIVDD